MTILNYTKILNAIRMNHEKYFAERKAIRDLHLDRLGDYLKEHPDEPT
ncbi:hypothetical protein [Paenibacillus radicis (ex Xue et al. 2023)]|uniref:Uncharacterized protein n=1 Tax=Paenibacillus radicis (ex Xue et al. 2023) TaxID=2972489 RepID=A0ABT1YM23_9BACL|nr:hypothetical protein [Paenibacillus radicis (ex Xue et al. 2023)]MCR8634240.1 hypothetical protein [Paenibacillus radicis (ex Xue et al. 2023)]